MLQHFVLSDHRSIPRSLRCWQPGAQRIFLRPAAMMLADARPLLARIVEALGANGAARLLGVERAQVSRFRAGAEAASARKWGAVL
jgi:hypothetical protein